MQIRSEELELLCGDAAQLERLCDGTARPQPWQPFDERVITYLGRVSRLLLHDNEAKAYPDVVTFGFFCRAANVRRLAEAYRTASVQRIGRGLAFHVAPSNVPINFAYTLVMGLLAGDVCIVKASSKAFVQTRIVADALSSAMEAMDMADMCSRVFVVQYGRAQQALTEAFSAVCHVRVIWGGDATIRAVRAAALPPRASDVTFADRYSLAVLSAAAVREAGKDAKRIQQLAQAFYNDTYLYDQNACSSPRLIYWLGKEADVREARARFWAAVHADIKARYPVEPVVAVDKWMAVCRTAIEVPGATLEPGRDNRIVRLTVPALERELQELRSAGGLFHECAAASLDALAAVVDEKVQTLAYYGLDPAALRAFVIAQGFLGIDRIVPVGRTAEMGTVWDGQDFIVSLSRIVATE